MKPVIIQTVDLSKIYGMGDIQVIALTSFREEELVNAALKAGAIGYLLKNVSTEELGQAIRLAYAGKMTLTSEAAQDLLQAKIPKRRT